MPQYLDSWVKTPFAIMKGPGHTICGGLFGYANPTGCSGDPTGRRYGGSYPRIIVEIGGRRRPDQTTLACPELLGV